MWVTAASVALVSPDVFAQQSPAAASTNASSPSTARPPSTVVPPSTTASAPASAERVDGPPVVPTPATAQRVLSVPVFASGPSPTTPTDAYARPAHQRRDVASALLGTGASLFLVSYLSTAFAGAVIWDDSRASSQGPMSRDVRRRLRYGATLMVPGVGPLVAMGWSGSAVRSMGLGISGALQVGGLVMTYIGARNHIRMNRQRWLSIGGAATSSLAQASLRIRF